MQPEIKNQDSRKQYEKPRLVKIELVAEEIMGSCKTGFGVAGYNSTNCEFCSQPIGS